MTKSIMKSRVIILCITIVGLLSIQASCKNTKVGGTADCPEKGVEELSSILKNRIQDKFTFYYAKLKVSIKDSKSSNSFNATVKMKPDSAFSGTVKVAGILGALYLIDQDTFAYAQKIEKCYKKQSFSALTKTFGTEINYSFMQQLILGQAVGIENIEVLYPLKDKQYYVLASHDKKAFQRLDAYNLSDEEQNDIFIKYKLDCGSLQLAKIEVNVPKDQTVIYVDFKKREPVEGIDLPEETAIKIVTPEDSVFIDLGYSRASLNEPKTIKLSIPDSYSECE